MKIIFCMVIALAGMVINTKAENVEKVKVAIAQIKCTNDDLEKNLERIESMIERADSAGARMVFFPETVDYGWVNPDAHRLASPVPGNLSDRISGFADKYDIWVGIGICEKDGEKLYDTALLFDDSGRISLKHRKINLLAWLMDPPYSAGDPQQISTAETPFGRLSILICADSHRGFDPDLCEVIAEKKPDLVYIPYGYAAPESKWPEHGFQLIRTVQRAAMIIGSPVIGPNVVGKITHGEWKGWTFEGLSTAADADGILLKQGAWNREDLIVFEIEPSNRNTR